MVRVRRRRESPEGHLRGSLAGGGGGASGFWLRWLFSQWPRAGRAPARRAASLPRAVGGDALPVPHALPCLPSLPLGTAEASKQPLPTEAAEAGPGPAAAPPHRAVELQQRGQRRGQRRGQQQREQQGGLRARAGAGGGPRGPGGWPGAAVSMAQRARRGPVDSRQAGCRQAVGRGRGGLGRLPQPSCRLQRGQQGSGRHSPGTHREGRPGPGPLRHPQRCRDGRREPTLGAHSALELRGASR